MPKLLQLARDGLGETASNVVVMNSLGVILMSQQA